MIAVAAREVIGDNPGLLVLSRLEAQDYQGAVPYVLISIRDPGQQVTLGDDPHRRAVLPLEFHDISDTELARHHMLTFMRPHLAKQAVEFVQEWREQVGLIVVHCEAGISRSAGVAAGLALWLHGDDRLFYDRFIPNALCKANVLRACRHLTELRDDATACVWSNNA